MEGDGDWEDNTERDETIHNRKNVFFRWLYKYKYFHWLYIHIKKKTGCNCFVLFNALLLLYSVLFNVLLFSLINMLFLLHFLKNFSFSLKVFVYKLLLFLLFLPEWFLCYSFKLQPKCGWPSGLDAHPLGFDDYFFNLLALPVKCNLFPPLTHY